MKRSTLFMMIFALVSGLQAQDYLKNLRGKTPGQIANATNGTFMDSTFFISRNGTPLRDMTAALLQRGYSADDFVSLAAAINKAESDTAMVIVAEKVKSLAATDTLHRTAALWVYKGGRISVATGVTFRIQGNFFAGNYQVFEGSGTVKFDEGSIDFVNPNWFGAVGDSSTVSLTGFQKALNSGVKKITVKVPTGTYLINDSLRIPSNVNFIGENSTIVSSDTNNYILTAGPLVKNIKISGFTMRYTHVNSVRQPNTSAIFIRECDTLEVSNNRIYGAPGMGMQIIACKAVRITKNWVERTLADGIHITNGLNTDTGRNIYSADFTITDNTVINTGDDHIAVVSYQRPVPSADTLTAGKNWTGSQEINRFGVISNNICRGGHNKTRSRGISVLGGRDIVISGNIIEGRSAVGDTNQTIVIAGILVQGGTSPFRFFRASRIVVSNNTIYKSKANHSGAAFELINGAIKLQGADSVRVVNNIIDWTPFMSGIMIYGDTILAQYTWNSTPKDIVIEGNTINNARLGVHLLQIVHTDTANRWISRVTIRNNRFSNLQRHGIVSTIANAVTIEGNEFFGVNAANFSSANNIDGIYFNIVGKEIVVRNNKFWKHGTGDTIRAAIHIDNPLLSAAYRTQAYAAEDDNISNFATTGTRVNITAAAAKDTTGFVLTAAGAADISGIGKVVLDTFGAALLDTVTALTGMPGQVVYISTRTADRDVIFLDGTNFRLNQGRVRLKNQEDMLMLKAVTPTIWKQIAPKSGNGDDNRFSVEDTIKVTLAAAGTATISGIGDLVLDTAGSAALDTVTTLTGKVGQVVQISSTNNSRDIRFLDSGNFDLIQERLLDNTSQVLTLKFTGASSANTSTTLKEVGFSDPNAGISTIALGSGATTFAITQARHVIDGDGGGNTIATITGGTAGMILVLRFVDASVTITDTGTGAANTVDLSAAFTSSANDILTLLFDGTSWYEVSRSVN